MIPVYKQLRSIVFRKLDSGVSVEDFLAQAIEKRAAFKAEREECDRRAVALAQTIMEMDTIIRILRQRRGRPRSRNCWTCRHRLDPDEHDGCVAAYDYDRDDVQAWINEYVRVEVAGPVEDGFGWPPREAPACPGYVCYDAPVHALCEHAREEKP